MKKALELYQQLGDLLVKDESTKDFRSKKEVKSVLQDINRLRMGIRPAGKL